jgi:NADH-quinone oxidoreductase subunit L
VLGIVFAFRLYKNLPKVAELTQRWKPIHELLENKWYVDELYDAVFIRPLKATFNFLWKGFDVNVIDRFVMGFGKASEWTGQTVRVIQTGSIQIYALMLLLGIIVSVGYLIYGMV